MATADDANLILRLYEQRREDVMRKARNFVMMEFFPTSKEDVMAAFADQQTSNYFRQVITYWDMACALVNHGALNADLFHETNGEAVAIFAKIEDFLPALREAFGPAYLANLEKRVKAWPDSEQRINRMKARFKQLAESKAAKS